MQKMNRTMSESMQETNVESPPKIDGRKNSRSLFKKGQSGNPNGRPKKIGPTPADLHRICVAGDLKTAAREYTGEALMTLVTIMRDESVSSNTRVTAANSILDRGFGKAVNQTEISVGIYDKLSDDELIKFISGETINSAAGIIDVTPNDVTPESVDNSEE